ncbi:MAG: Protein YhgF [Hyphomicrobiaceae bacterium hypho_1]
MESLELRIAEELKIRSCQVAATIALLNQGATVPFIARYRKEITGGLNDTQLRKLEQRLMYLQQLNERKATILKIIDDQGKLSSNLKHDISTAKDKVSLEDLYAPFKQKRFNKAQVARDSGLTHLADALLFKPMLDPTEEAARYQGKAKFFTSTQAVLDGARSILIERICNDSHLVGKLREILWTDGYIIAKPFKIKRDSSKKFENYYNFHQSIIKLPSHRALALMRGRKEGVLKLTIDVNFEEGVIHPFVFKIMSHFRIANLGRKADDWLIKTAIIAWEKKLHPSLITNLLSRVKELADIDSINIFKSNLRELLLAAPAGPKVTMGIDPGIKNGVKVAVVDCTGKLLDTGLVFPHAPRNEWHMAMRVLSELCSRHRVELIAIGNGTASRETDRLVSELINNETHLKLNKVIVSEAGASVYSASKIASEEFPHLDVCLRGAVSIARRLQDPLAELVKIAPKSIGVGQYQHDVDQKELSQSLISVLEDCVNLVGVNINTASESLLTRVSGLNATVARNIVSYRNKNGAFKNRNEIKKVPRLGPKLFEQSAGFLRVLNGQDVLDASAVHPEAYKVVKQIAKVSGRSIKSMIGNEHFLKSLNPIKFVTKDFGLPTVCDILKELEKPGSDPRPNFKSAKFAEGVEKISDLRDGMILEGVVTNVTSFGAFVDIGVHHDGLVHVSEIDVKYIKDPREVIKAGDIIKVRAKKIDVERKRITLSMKSNSL